MLVLGLILLAVGWFTWRPLFIIGAILTVIGLILWLTSGVWYGYNAAMSVEEVGAWTTTYFS